jgi:AraC-like DNA-binding protein
MAKGAFRYHSSDWLTEHITIVRKTIRYAVDIHMHSFYEIELITGGSGTLVLNGQNYNLQAGTLMLLTPIDFHSITPEDSLDIINISFHESIVNTQLQNIFVNPSCNILFQLEDAQQDTFCLYAQLLEAELCEKDEFCESELENLLNTMLVAIARYMRVTDGMVPSPNIPRIHAALSYLLKNFTHNLSLCAVAAQSGYTPNHFSKLFKEFTGRTYIDFLNSLRVNYARMLLISTEDSVLDIAQNSGFDSLSNFSRVFKEISGETPIAYRKKRLS